MRRKIVPLPETLWCLWNSSQSSKVSFLHTSMHPSNILKFLFVYLKPFITHLGKITQVILPRQMEFYFCAHPGRRWSDLFDSLWMTIPFFPFYFCARLCVWQFVDGNFASLDNQFDKKWLHERSFLPFLLILVFRYEAVSYSLWISLLVISLQFLSSLIKSFLQKSCPILSFRKELYLFL